MDKQENTTKGSLTFVHGSMGVGKSYFLLKCYNLYDDRQKEHIALFKSSVDTRDEGFIHTRNGEYPDVPCKTVDPTQRISDLIDFENDPPEFIFVDEAQFLTEEQVNDLSNIVDTYGVCVHCYGLSTDFQTKLFPGSKRLFELADFIMSLDTNNERFINARIGKDGKPVVNGSQIEVGAEDRYRAVIRSTFKKELGPLAEKLFPTTK